MIAFGPARAFETDCLEREEGNRDEKNQQAPPEKSEHGYIAANGNRVADRRMSRVAFRFDAQIIMSRRDARYDDVILAAALGPIAVAVSAGVVADFASEIPRAAGVLIDERVIQVDPIVGDVGFRFNRDVGLATLQLKDVGDKRGFAFRRA